MTAQGRENDREGAADGARIWQMYADEIGLPEARSMPSDDSGRGPGQPATPTGRWRRVVVKSVRGVAVAAAVVVALIAVAAVGVQLRAAFGPVQHRPPTSASREADPSDTSVPRSEPSTPAGPGRDVAAADPRTPSAPAAPAPVAPAPVAPAPAAPVRAQQTPTDAVPATPAESSPSAAYRSDATAPKKPVVTERKPEPANLTYRINFDFGSDVIDAEAKRTLDKIARAMKANPDWLLVIEGHTDAHGTPEYNRSLSQRRAQAAKAYLESAGISPRRLSAVGFGDSRPVAPNAGELGFLNRRVELHRL